MNDIELTIFPAAHPSRYGSGLCIQYGTAPSPFGDCFIAVSEVGICYLGFPQAAQSQPITDWLRREWPEADMKENHAVIKELVRKIFQADQKQPLKIVLKGTDFQLAVWKALLAIPKGSVSNYTDIAQKVKRPKAVRAVGAAIGQNPHAIVVPCHRVLGANGSLTGFAGGLERKRFLLTHETAHA